MKLHDQQPCSLDVRDILADRNRRDIVVRELQKALAAFGYKNTLQTLQTQSKIPFEKEKTATIQNLLQNFNYEGAREQIKLLKLPHSQKEKLIDSVDELYVGYLADQDKIEKAITFITSADIRQDRKSRYYAIIGLQNPIINSQQVQEQHKAIVQRCKLYSPSQLNTNNLLNAYLLQNSLSNKSKNNPPKTITAQSEGGLSIAGVPQFIKFNWNADRLIVVSQAKQEYEVSLWAIDGQRVRKICRFKQRANGVITSVEWSSKEVSGGELVGVCSYEELVILAACDLSIACRISRTTFDLPKLLTFAWHPVSQVIYLGGLFSKLMGFDVSGEVVTEVCPFMTCRKVAFSPKGELFAITATNKGRAVRFNLEEESIQAQFTRESLFMDLKWRSQKIILTNNQLIFILDASTLQPIYTCQAPPNPNLLTIQAFLFGEWLIVFNEKVRGTLQGGNFVTQTKWDNCQAIDVHQKAMVSIGSSSIKIWASDDGSPEVISYGSNGGFESENVSYSDQSSSSSPEEPSEQQVDNQQLQAYRELMEIEFMNNLDPNDSSE